MLDLSFDAIIVWRLGGTIESWNVGAEELYGFSRGEALGCVSHDLLATMYPRTWAEIEAILRENGSWEGEVRHRAKDGREVVAATRHQLIRGGDGVDRVLETNRDVTESRRVHDALRERDGRLRMMLANSRDGINMLDLATGRYLFLSPAQVELTGFTEEELQGITAEEAFERVHPEDREASIAQQQKVAAGEDLAETVEYRWKVKSGEYRWFSDRRKLVRDEQGLPIALVGVSRDVTEQKLAEAERELLLEAAGALTRSLTLTEVLDALARVILEAGGHSRVAISLWDEEQERLVLARSRGQAAMAPGLPVEIDDLSAPARHAIESGETVVIDYDALVPGRRGVADRVTSHLALAVPLLFGERFVGLLATDDPGARREFSDRQIHLIEGIAAHATLAIENARLYEREAESARLATVLNGINALVNSTLEASDIMRILVKQALAAVGADSAMVALRHGDDWVAEYGYPEVPGVIHETVRAEEAPFILTAVAERRPVAIDDCDNDPRCIPEVQRRFGVRSVLCLPVIVRNGVLGVIFFNHHRASTHFPPAIVDFGAKLAVAISTALTNARLYEEQKRIATALQENFIRPLSNIPGAEIGVVSQAAYAPELVGGDFCDVFELTDGRVAVLIGDVAGKGIRAAGLTETARSMVRAFAAVDPSPALVLERTNEALLRYDPAAHHITAFLAVLDLQTGHALYVSAGHPAAVHVSPSSCRLLEVNHGLPLHSFPTTYMNEHARLGLDDYLLLYTDGLTEARRDGELFGEDRLLDVLGTGSDLSPEELARYLRDAVLAWAGELKDDLEILVLRRCMQRSTGAARARPLGHPRSKQTRT